MTAVSGFGIMAAMKKASILLAAAAFAAVAFANQPQPAATAAEAQQKDPIMQIDDMLSKSGAFYLATVDGDQPKLRPLGAHHVVDGKVWNSEILTYPDAGMVFTFSCPEESSHAAEFRCFWLPREATEGLTDEEGWTKRLFCDTGSRIPYCIETCETIRVGSQRVINGDVEVIKEEHWDSWNVLELSSDYTKLPISAYDRANYILLFDESCGFLVVISGEEELETLEHIAREMEIRESEEPKFVYPGSSGIGILDLGRG